MKRIGLAVVFLGIIPACGGGSGGSPAPAVLTITTASLPNGMVSSAYSSTLSATNGTPPYTWSLSSGALPPGLTIGALTGTISGNPTSTGTFGFTILVSDSTLSSDIHPLSITIAPGPLVITTTTLPSGSVGNPYSATIAATGGTTPYTWNISVGTLPSGLSFNPSTGTVSGTPTGSGTTNFTARVQDTVANADTQSLSITVNAAASGGMLVWSSSSDPTTDIDVPSAIAPTSSGLFVAGMQNATTSGSTSAWRAEKRFVSDGTFVTTFGTNGALVSDPGVTSDFLTGIATDPTAVFLC